MPRTMIPYERIAALTVDVGNTLISIDFEHVAAQLTARGVEVAAETLRRAEAAARPAVSRALALPRQPDDEEPFVVYLRAVVAQLPRAAAAPHDVGPSLLADLASALRGDRASRLWRVVMPGVPEALASLRTLGLPMAVVSNSDGTIEEILAKAGLRSFFQCVVDSAVVGYEKPDPRIFATALDAMRVPADRALHVGDFYEADIVGARQAGMHAVLLDPFDDWPPLDCERLPDLQALVERLQQGAGPGPFRPSPERPRRG